ncbi:hypothetical protein L195_g000544 [Trifolium pratense]|uniref:Uncharacterized protein n=1 Tax=Trifolium pratense TaxID=57577 RepID=A0A2K3NM55_TRIPR|nr:hypothetical protein L195_g000544 [Trifolium pratense]
MLLKAADAAAIVTWSGFFEVTAPSHTGASRMGKAAGADNIARAERVRCGWSG